MDYNEVISKALLAAETKRQKAIDDEEKRKTAIAKAVAQVNAFIESTVLPELEAARTALESSQVRADIGNGRSGTGMRRSLSIYSPSGVKTLTFECAENGHGIQVKSPWYESSGSLRDEAETVRDTIAEFITKAVTS